VSGRLAGLPVGPVLVVADGAAIARGGPAWAETLAAEGRHHRVRLAGRGDPAEIAALTAEARNLGAAVILGAGEPATLATAAAVATALGIPSAGARNLTGEG
jgi:glycerol dehydrogenase-like iron-containing ADH family enzyme